MTNVIMLTHYAERQYAEYTDCRYLSECRLAVIMTNVTILSVIMLSANILNVIKLSVVASLINSKFCSLAKVLSQYLKFWTSLKQDTKNSYFSHLLNATF